MVNRTIGHIILRGGTSEELRKQIPDFPLKPTKDYFCDLGYKESTAKTYVKKLRINDKKSLSNTSAIQSVQIPKTRTPLEETFIKSENVDFKNLLIDTCALGNHKTIDLIEKAEHVTFIYSTIEEMDKKTVKRKKSLHSSIRRYSNKILEDSEKYMLSTFSGIDDEKYPDNILLQYLLILPKQIRPTLLTADQNLAVKAKTWNLQYIFFDVSKSKKQSGAGYKKVGFGVYKKKDKDGSTFIEYKGTHNLDIIHPNGTSTQYKGGLARVKSGDKICIYEKIKRDIVPRYLELN